MRIIDKRNNSSVVHFSDLRPGDTYIDESGGLCMKLNVKNGNNCLLLEDFTLAIEQNCTQVEPIESKLIIE